MRLGKVRLLAVGLFIIVGAFLAASRSVTADKPAQGITVSPPLSLVSVQSTESEHPLTFQVTNDRTVPQTLQLSGADFNSLQDSGGLLFVGTTPNGSEKSYGLANWLDIPQKTITIPPKQTATVKVAIVNRPDLAPGGHYGALLFGLDNGKGQGSDVSLHPIATSLLFVTKLGGDTHILSLDKVKTDHNLFRLPSNVTLYFRNVGNTHLIPRGTVVITDPHGKLISQGVINEDSNIILPGKTRIYSVNLRSLGPSRQPGYYHLTVNYRFDGYENFRMYRTKLAFLTPLSIVIALAALVVLITLVTYFRLHGHKKYGWSRNGFFQR